MNEPTELVIELIGHAIKWIFIGFFTAVGVGIGFKLMGLTLKIALGVVE